MPLIPNDQQSIAQHAAYLAFGIGTLLFMALLLTRTRWDKRHRFGWVPIVIVLSFDLLGVAMLGYRVDGTVAATVLACVFFVQFLLGSAVYYGKQKPRRYENNERNFRD